MVQQCVILTNGVSHWITQPRRSEIAPNDGNKPVQIHAPPSLPEPYRSVFGERRLTEAALGDLVNLNRHRKRVERDRSAKQADENRARFGRSKSERAIEDNRAHRAKTLLDQHRIDKDQT
jgi:hypothetical protein